MSEKINRDSPLVQAVLALDNHLSELERVGNKINATDLSTDFDVDYIQKLLNHFAECGKGISEQVANLSASLQEAQARAESTARGVSRQAELVHLRRQEEDRKLEEFRLLGERVRDLNTTLNQFRPSPGNVMSDEDRAKLKADLPVFEAQLTALIDELQNLRQTARDSHMRSLEKNAESLAQTLEAVRKRLVDV
jgi:hypothetical protein